MIRERQQCNFDFRYYMYVHIHGDVTRPVIRPPIHWGGPGGTRPPPPHAPERHFVVIVPVEECSTGTHVIREVVCNLSYSPKGITAREGRPKTSLCAHMQYRQPLPDRPDKKTHLRPQTPTASRAECCRMVKFVSARDTERHRGDAALECRLIILTTSKKKKEPRAPV